MTLRDSIAAQFQAVTLAGATSPTSDEVNPRRLGFTDATPSTGESISTFSLIGGGVLATLPGRKGPQWTYGERARRKGEK